MTENEKEPVWFECPLWGEDGQFVTIRCTDIQGVRSTEVSGTVITTTFGVVRTSLKYTDVTKFIFGS